jgi:hypothetical protein
MLGATCGGPEKYLGRSEFSYGQLLGALFSNGVERVFHIGNMPPTQKSQICADIAASGQDASRLTFLPVVPCLATKLVELSPDFFLTSHPVAGAKATVEAMSVGLPIVNVRTANTLPLLCPDMTFGTSVPLPALDNISSAIRRLDTQKTRFAKRSREIYEKHYSPSAFRDGLLAAISAN